MLEKFWNKVFHKKEECKHFSAGICLKKTWEEPIQGLGLFSEEEIYCRGVCEGFEKKKSS